MSDLATEAPEAAAPSGDGVPALLSAVLPVTPVVATATGTPDRVGRFDYRWVALGVVLGGTIMTILDATVVNVAIPTLQSALNARSYSDIAWVVTGYMLAQGAVIPMTGWATDRFGTKRLYLITLALFTLASMLCGFAWNLPTLILFRVLQGLGGGMLMPIGLTIIMRAVGPSQMGRAMGYFGVPMLIGPAVGPLLGGWLAEDFSWRLIFFINVPIGAIALLAAWRLLQETPMSSSFRLDVIGLLTATPAVIALMYGVDRSIDLGWGAPLVVAMLCASALLFALFVARQLKAIQPLLDLRLFRDSGFSMSVVLTLVMVTGLFGGMYLLPLFLQQVHGYDAITTGLLLMPQAVTAAAAMPLGGALTDRLGPRPVVIFGLSVLIVSSVLLALVTPSTSLLFLVLAMSLRGLSMGFAMMPASAAGLARIPRDLASRASSITNTVQRAGASVGIAVLVTVLAAQATPAAAAASCDPSPVVLASSAAHRLTGDDGGAPVSRDALCAALRDQAGRFSRDRPAAALTADPEFASFVKNFSDDAAARSFDRTFVFIVIITALGIVPAYFLKRPQREHGRGASRGTAAA